MKAIRTLNTEYTEHYYLTLQFHNFRKVYNIMLWHKTSSKKDILVKSYSCDSKAEAEDVFNKWCIYAHKEEERIK